MPQSLSTLLVHLVFSTKHREPLIRGGVQSELHAYATAVLKNAGCAQSGRRPVQHSLGYEIARPTQDGDKDHEPDQNPSSSDAVHFSTVGQRWLCLGAGGMGVILAREGRLLCQAYAVESDVILSCSMIEEKSTHLLLCLHGDKELTAALEFLPANSDIDGIWVHTTLTVEGFRSEFDWYLATKSQQELASLARDLSGTNGASQFAIYDTDCSFAATFTRSSCGERFDVAVEYRSLWGGSAAADSAILLDLKHASAPLSEVQRLLQNLSRFS